MIFHKPLDRFSSYSHHNNITSQHEILHLIRFWWSLVKVKGQKAHLTIFKKKLIHMIYEPLDIYFIDDDRGRWEYIYVSPRSLRFYSVRCKFKKLVCCYQWTLHRLHLLFLQPTTTDSPSHMIDLYPGCGVKISVSQLNLCRRKAKDSPTAMSRLLLLVFFYQTVLSESCARGNSKRRALDAGIVDAIVRKLILKFFWNTIPRIKYVSRLTIYQIYSYV